MFKKLRSALLILYLGQFHEIDFRTLNKQGVSRYQWDNGIALLKQFHLIKLDKGKWKVKPFG